MGDGTEGTWSQGTTQADPGAKIHGLVASSAVRKGLVKTLHKGKLIRLGDSLKVEGEAIKDHPMVS